MNIRPTKLEPKNGKFSGGKKRSSLASAFAGPAMIIFTFLAILLLVHIGSRPKTYNLHVSDASPYDIEAPRSIVNFSETHRRATEAAAQVPNKLSMSEEISRSSLARVSQFIDLAKARRNQLYHLSADGSTSDGQGIYSPGASEITGATTAFLSEVKQNLDIDLEVADAQELMEMSQGRFQVFVNNLTSSSEVIMKSPVDEVKLPDAITTQINQLYATENYYRNDNIIIADFLKKLLRPNVIFNQEATDNAKKDAFNRVQQNPIMINRGTRIVSEGDIITEETYALLKELNLIDSDRIDWQILAGQALLVLIVTVLCLTFLRFHRRELLSVGRESMTLVVSVLLPLVVAAALGQNYQLAPPVYFTAVLISSYFSFQMSMVFTTGLILVVMPMVNFNPAFLIVGLIGSLVAALFTQGISNQDKFATLILATAGANLLSSAAYSLMQRSSWSALGLAVSSSVISGVASVIAAIGLMPLFEMFFNTVSPTRLIELSQPGHPLLRRLFVEAPGTSQHSMMVANLADAAAEAVGANAMICRVGAYYHDIGKLENPLMFTENQQDYNPHDYMTPEESASIITRHPEDGLKLGRKNRLPLPVLRIIEEHHGTTVLQYFYHRAKEIAERDGKPEPDPDDFRYPTPIPSSRESAIVMLADSTEAAMKSSGADNLTDAEAMMRNVFKIKNDQNQLNQSGLSYADVDKIMKAFLQVYAGQFHERVKYPDAKSETVNRKSPEKV